MAEALFPEYVCLFKKIKIGATFFGCVYTGQFFFGLVCLDLVTTNLVF